MKNLKTKIVIGTSRLGWHIARDGTKFEYDQSSSFQSSALSALGMTVDQAKTYEKYCKRTK